MKKNRPNLFKLCAVVLALAVFAAGLVGGRLGPGTPAAVAATTVQTTDAGDNLPRVDEVAATPLEAETAEGNARLLVKFAADQKVAPEVKTVIDDRDVLLRDDGAGGDEVAGDGTHSAIIFLDFNSLADNQDEIQAINSQPEPSPTPEEKETTTTGGVETSEAASAAGTAGAAEQQDAATTSDQPTVTDEERADTTLASDSAILVPDFDDTRDMVGLKAEPLIDFRGARPGQIIPLRRIGTHRRVVPEKSLVITNVRVVEDPARTFNPCTNVGTPMGAWTFGRLMTDMANQPVTGINPSTFVRLWLDKWMNDQTINGWTVAKRQQIKQLVIDPWEAASGGPGRPLNLAIAPFKLLAIVNRVDLRTNTVYGGGNAGEGRLVFGVIDRRATGAIDPYTGQPVRGCGETQFTVIFEYGIDRRGCGVRDWGRQWHNLRNYVLGSARYNAALQAITDQFTRANVAPHKPNRSALNQLRTNEVALVLGTPAPVWELREFKIGGDPGVNPGQLEEATVKRTPDLTRNRTDLLTHFVNTNTPAILLEQHDVPPTWLGQLFLGGSSLAPRNPLAAVDVNTHWDHRRGGPMITNREARHKFSLNTCNACHTGETNTVFTHIKPVPFGTEARLSGFMNGIDPNTNTRPFKVVDPADGAPTRKFNEFRRRAIDLDILVHSPCFFDIGRRNVLSVH